MNRKNVLFLLVFAGIFNSFAAIAQKDTTNSGCISITKIIPPSVKFSGFVNSEIFYDTRQTTGGRETLLMLYPAAKSPDIHGFDLNSKGNFNQLAMMSRLTANITGPDVLNAKTIGVIEADFTGTSDATNNIFRLRHAYIKLTWKSDELLIGNYWTPFDVAEMIPAVISLNTGAPFHSFSRNPQVRYVHNFNNLKLIAVALSQRDYASNGPLGVSSVYMRDAIVPEMHLQLQYNIGGHLFGVGGEYKCIQPRLATYKNIASDEKLESTAIIAFAKLNFPNLDIKLQGSYGGNISDHTMIGGYIESSIDTISGITKYANANSLDIWTDISTKSKKLNVGLFAGYYKNMGYSSDIATGGKFYGNVNNIGYLYRIAPRLTYTAGAVMFALELEYTAAQYGTPDIKGKMINPYEIGNFRTLFGAFYFF